ncbi:hypothetical protein ART_0312 [Arthrobacter sp. PAMC 25486]|nr:hypothetical protein ART_0312 [Arthrobacter sp. PAMC 25486]
MKRAGSANSPETTKSETDHYTEGDYSAAGIPDPEPEAETESEYPAHS